VNANEEAIEAWNTVLFDKFLHYRDIVIGGLEPHGRTALDRLALPKGAAVVDLGCGFGDTTQDIARRIGPTGRVVGVDAAERSIALARDEARAIPNASFEVADVQAGVPGGPYDYAFSRMGMMFFLSPVIALRSVRAALVPGGTLCMVVWRTKSANDAFALPEQAVVNVLGGHPDKGDNVTCGPGPFSMASCDVTSDQLVAAGFTNIAFQRSDIEMFVGKDVGSAVELALTLGPAGEVVRLAGDAAQAKRAEIVAAVTDVLAPYARADGVFAPTSCWIVTARA
jgi:SAM-dependent methyltransferase